MVSTLDGRVSISRSRTLIVSPSLDTVIIVSSISALNILEAVPRDNSGEVAYPISSEPLPLVLDPGTSNLANGSWTSILILRRGLLR